MNTRFHIIAVLICVFAFGVFRGFAISASTADLYWTKFDKYSNITWKQERKRIDNFIVQLRKSKNVRAYVIVYAGQRSCEGEALARAQRVKNYITRSGALSTDRITIIDAGYHEAWTISLEFGAMNGPPLTLEIVSAVAPSRPRSEVQVFKNCTGKLY